ncbi:exosortase A [Rheinheimera sp.]|uniref:exosortase A n=1 Tax=Rheinheimera sp. TaxID=1869214 RepID=UPI002733EA4E|nr:exosortase A [Rheinheimera sp.]MDP2715869.1 exosortase A [Rheinheimera sp.]
MVNALPIRLLLLLLALICYILLYADAWLDMERVWRSSATYNHCYLILPISLYFFYRAKTSVNTNSSAVPVAWLPLLILITTQFVWLLGFAADIALLMHLAAVVTLQMLLWLVLGSRVARRYVFAIGYLIFLVPFGEELSPLLQDITADLTVMMLHWVNIPVYREGLYLATPAGLFEVAEACSGLRFLIASIAISVLFSYLTFNRIWKHVSFVVFMALISVLANGVRAFMLVYIGEVSNMRFGFGADHYLYGWLFFGAVLLAGFWLGGRFADQEVALSRSNSSNATPQLQSSVVICSLFTLAATLSFTLSLHAQTTPDSAVSVSLPFATNTNAIADWGISFPHSQALGKGTDNAGISYFVAFYANKQHVGELISWQNALFDPKRWQVQDRVARDNTVILQLKARDGSYRSLLYWYQIGQHSVISSPQAKLHQALAFLTDDSSVAAVYAVSVAGKADEGEVQLLRRAAQTLQQTAALPTVAVTGADYD